jgi:predicted dehydrogenase
MTSKARLAVIGTGWWATTAHLPAIRKHPDAELVALADRRPEALQKAVAAYGPARTYTDYRQMLAQEGLDGVVVAVNHTAHYAVARHCLQAGLHVLLEKPMTLTATDAHRLLALAGRRKRELIVGYPYHYNPLAQQARRLLQSGWLGHVQYVSCLFASMVVEFYRGNDQAYAPPTGYPVTGPGQAYADPKLSGGGQGHLQVTHSAALMFYLTGLQPERVTAFMEDWDVPVDLVDAIAVRFKPAEGHAAVGVIGSTGNVGIGGQPRLEIQVYCEHGSLVLDQTAGLLRARHHDGTEQTYGPPAPAEAYPREAPVNNLVDVILGRDENRSLPSVGVTTVELLEAAYLSAARQGRPVRVASLVKSARSAKVR